MGKADESRTTTLQTDTTFSESSQTCISIQNLTTTTDGNYETVGDVSLDVDWNIPDGQTLTVKGENTFIIASKLTVIGKIIVQGTLDNLSANSLNITRTDAVTGVVIVEENGILNNGNGTLKGSLGNSGSLVVYGTLNNNPGSTLDNTGEVSYSGTIKNNNGTITNQGIFYESVVGKPPFEGKPTELEPVPGLFGTLTSDTTITITNRIINVPKNTELIINSNDGITIFDREIDNFGTITINKTINILIGKITNNSIINNNSVINNYGVIDNYQNISNKGTINNERGKINNIEPNGTINPRGIINDGQPKEVSSVKEVYAGLFNGYVVVYAKGYVGFPLSSKVGKKWLAVQTLGSNFESVVEYTEYTRPGVVVPVSIYIDNVQVEKINLITK